MIKTLEALENEFKRLKALPQHKRLICRAWLGRTAWPEESDERLPKTLRAELKEIRETLKGVTKIAGQFPGAEKESERLLLTLNDGQTIESVLLPREGVCVSTQLGCAVGCVFCMTGKGGLIRQLTDLEIVAQVALARKLRPTTKKIAFMGMGEPSHNLKAVMNAINFLGTYGDFGHKSMVVSSVGDRRLFEMLDNNTIRPALAISLHTVDDEKRQRLLPHGARMSVDELMDKAEAWARLSGYPIQYQWTLIKGVNDSLEEIAVLKEKLKGKYAMMNFIPVNVVPGSPYERPDMEHAKTLVRTLRNDGIIATLRISAAQDVDGGCGQLRARHLEEKGAKDRS